MTSTEPRAQASGVPGELAAAGVIAVFAFPPALAQQLAVPGGVPPEQLHLTLAFLGDAASLGAARLEAARQSMRELASRTPPLAARITGAGRFSVPGGKDVAYLSIDAPELPALREALLCELAQGAGLEADQSHGFTPHVTLAFIPPGAPHPREHVRPFALRFDALELWTGPLHETFGLRPARPLMSGCEAEEASRAALGEVAPAAIAAVVRDWIAPAAALLAARSPAGRLRWLPENLDALHTRVLAAYLASPHGALRPGLPANALEERAGRLRSVETDLGFIFAAVSRELRLKLAGAREEQLPALLQAVLEPLLVWAAAAEE